MSRQNGFALAAAMMVLALLSVLGAAALQSTTLEVKISAHDRDAREALYVAEATMEEARYYAARGWGKIADAGVNRVQVSTAVPHPPGFSWDGNRYAGFSLVDETGQRFTVVSHDDDSHANPEIDLAPGSNPAAGRFVLVREGFPAAWDGSSRLVVEDVDAPAWAAHSGSDTWKGWLLWNAAGRSFLVQGSDTTFANQVRLELSTDPGAGPFSLSLNPWLAGLAAGVAPLPEDADATTSDRWDRTFAGLGQGYAEAQRTTSGSYADTYRLTCRGEVGQSTGEITLRVYRAGRPDQRTIDWVVQ